MESNTIVAAALGVLEGLTEFIPVSSTGHILLAGHFLGFDSPGRSFEVLIQLGALLAILGVYSTRIVQILSAAPHDPAARRFLGAVLLARQLGGRERRERADAARRQGHPQAACPQPLDQGTGAGGGAQVGYQLPKMPDPAVRQALAPLALGVQPG